MHDPLILDCSFDLADPEAGERAYAAGHVPGAFYLHLDRDLAGPKTGPDGAFRGRHPLPEREVFAALLRRLGLRAGRQVVSLDRQGGPYAARAWWMLRWLGHAEVAVLDGAWDGELSTEAAVATASDWQPGAPLVDLIDAATLQARLGKVRLIDARAPERFRGEVEPLDRAAGHIPGGSQPLLQGQPRRRRPLQAGGSAAHGIPDPVQSSRERRRRAPMRLGRHGLPQPAGDGPCGPW